MLFVVCRFIYFSFKNQVFGKKNLTGIPLSVKQIGSRSGPTMCRVQLVCKISRRQLGDRVHHVCCCHPFPQTINSYWCLREGFVLFVICVDALCPSQQFFSYNGMFSRLLGLNQYKAEQLKETIPPVCQD